MTDIDATEKAIELAESMGIDLDQVEGSGKDGRVIVADVRKTAPPEPHPDAAELMRRFERRGQVLDVFGAFQSRVLIEVPTELAAEIFRQGLVSAAPGNVVEAIEHDIELLREVSDEVADSAFAATAVRLAYELQNPFNSATSKSMCARSMIEALDRLRELAPLPEEADGIDELAAKRDERLLAEQAAREAAAKG